MKTFIKILKWAGIAIVVAGGFWYWNAHNKPFVARDFDEVAAELKDPKKIERYAKQLEEAYKKDFDGGDTPEETLNLFIAALKVGNTDLAAKYFLLEEQEKQRKELQVGKEKGNIDFFLSFLMKAENRSGNEDERAIMTVVENGKAVMSIEFVRNPYTKKWKIESL